MGSEMCIRDSYYPTKLFDESVSQQEGLITRQDTPSFEPETPAQWVVSGPHFFVGTPFNRSARTNCVHNNAYDGVDLTDLAEDYLPRSVYRPGNDKGNTATLNEKIPRWPAEEPISSSYRYVNREMIGSTSERTLISSVIPPGAVHILSLIHI